MQLLCKERKEASALSCRRMTNGSHSFEGEKLKKVAVGGGVPSVLCDTQLEWGADRGSDNRIIFSQGEPAALYQIPEDGGQPERTDDSGS